jgi:hypothetical protein
MPYMSRKREWINIVDGAVIENQEPEVCHVLQAVKIL